MKSRRPLSINNSLVHGICNYNCRLCGINKPGYHGPRQYQPLEVTRTLIRRIQEAAASGIHIRYVANAGDGEPTLHPEFRERLELFGSMLRHWDIPNIPPPEVSVVTNGSRLMRPDILKALSDNGLTLIISLPTLHPTSYGVIMTNDSRKGENLLSAVLPGIARAMSLKASNKLSGLYFHISPPEMKIIRRDLPTTLDTLTRLAAKNGLRQLRLVLFPAPSNRTGLVTHDKIPGIDMYRDIFAQYNNKRINGITLRLQLVLKRFFPSLREIVDLLKSFHFPCLWNANFFIAPDGSSICCNDQAMLAVQGNIVSDSISTLLEAKERFRPGMACADCNQSPMRVTGSGITRLYSMAVRARLRLGSYNTRQQPPKSANQPVTGPGKIKLAANITEMREAFHLIYDKYTSAGFQQPHPSGLRINVFNLLPTSNLLIYCEGEQLSGTLTLVRECENQLPARELFAAEIDAMKKTGSKICELSCLAVDSTALKKSKAILFALFRSAFLLAHDLLGCTDFCMMINPAHCHFYEKELHFSRLGEVKYYEKVNGAPAVFLRLNLTEAQQIFSRHSSRLHEYFFRTDRHKTGEQLKKELRAQNKLFTNNLISQFQQEKTDLLTGLSVEEKQLLTRYFPGFREAA